MKPNPIQTRPRDLMTMQLPLFQNGQVLPGLDEKEREAVIAVLAGLILEAAESAEQGGADE